MSVRRVFVLTSLLATLVSACGTAAPQGSDPDPATDSRSHQESRGAESLLAKLPLSFIESHGQADSRTAFQLHGGRTAVSFTDTGLALALADRSGTDERWGLRLNFDGARRVRPVGQERLAGVVSYFRGSPGDWKANLPTYGRIIYRDLWPHVHLTYAGKRGALKYELRVAPGANPDDIRLRWQGATDVRVEEDGSLSVVTPAGTITDAPPVSFQMIGDRRIRVPTEYVLNGDAVGFRLGAYDPSRPLVIDPTLLVYAGYIGGGGDDLGFSVAVDATGAAYVTGQTDSSPDSFPEAVGPFLTKGDGADAFVVKVNPEGTALVYAGYIGGAGDEGGYGIAVDATGAAYVTGPTTSDDSTFPETVGPDLTKPLSDADAFVAKVSPGGTALVYAGYVGGIGSDEGFGIAVDTAGAAYVTGYTDSVLGFPTQDGPDTTKPGGSDAFITKVLPDGTGFDYSGFIGGAGEDFGNSVALDGTGAAYVTGDTDSDQVTFPETGGPDLTYNLGTDAFVAKVNPGGTALVYAGYIGGDDLDVPLSIAVDGAMAAYVTGFTFSDAATFPETVGPFLTRSGGRDAFVAKVAPGGASLTYAGYLGGAGDDRGHAIAVDSSGAAYLTGRTDSKAETFPETVGPSLVPGGELDAFVAKVNAGGTALLYAGFLGGAGRDVGYGIAVDGSGRAFVSGETASLPTIVGPDLMHNLGTDAFVAKVAAECRGTVATIVGTDGPDVLTGTVGSDVIISYGGGDTIDGGAGNDLICAGDGDDVMTGGDGNDTLDGEAGTDTASFPGTAGVVVDLAAGTATGQGSDTLANVENLIGSSANDTLTGDAGPNLVTGSDGDDILTGAGSEDELGGGLGKDTASGGTGDDAMTGGAGEDAMTGEEGNDVMTGGEGNDVMNGGAGDDSIFAGAGKDVASGGSGKDTVKGEGGADRLTGGAGADRLLGGKGADRLNGGGGNDVLKGGKGKDTCNGGKGRDTAMGCETRRKLP